MKKVIQFDMDGVLVNFQSGIDKLSIELKEEYIGRLDEVDGIFGKMEPNKGAIEAYNLLDTYYECNICSTASWNNSSAWSDKLLWIKRYLPKAFKNLTLTHRKDNVFGNYLIDDRVDKNGADKFKGELIPFGSSGFETWPQVVNYLLRKDGYV
ncbi:hypothetical protein H7F37_03035 [Winogradskyella sp. PAMC22761]|nr:hypothetical protein H7F37_03035 [Winogradskyella sp. PAMC22761]